MYDIVIIGAGVVGGMIARSLCRYDLKICILEKENDVAMGSTKSNSAIVHAGFDAKSGTLKAKLNVRGSEMMEQVARELGVKYKRNGALVVGFSEEDKVTIDSLYQRGIENGVKNLSVLDKAALKELEPNVSDDAECALYAPTSAIICPYELTIAAIGNAMDNGAELRLNFPVTSIVKEDDVYAVYSNDDSVKTKIIINAAGIYADNIASMVNDNSFTITPRKGEYILLDKVCSKTVKSTVFRTPSKMGKGILVTPTVDGNLLTGPTSENVDDKDDKSTTEEGLKKVMDSVSETVSSVQFGKSITSFCGLRAVGSTGDFIINSPEKGFINAAGIESPGLSASPAIAEMIVGMVKEQLPEIKEDPNYDPIRKPMHSFRDADINEKNEIIKKDPSYGRIICRCESVSEGEILAAIRANPKPRDLDGVKRRTRAQMGRCQGGFCTPYIMKLLSEELNVPLEEITKCGGRSYILASHTKEDVHYD